MHQTEDHSIDVPEAWREAADRLLREGRQRVLLLGGNDVGKSTFCGYLLGRLAEQGVPGALVDADVGQKDIGPPAAITLGFPRPGAALGATPPAGFYFVGDCDPVGHLLPMAVGTARLARAAQPRAVVINTSGLIEGAGLALKTYKADAVEPDAVVAIERADELSALLQGLRFLPTLRLRPSPLVRSKSPAARRKRRAEAFGAYFASAARHRLPLERLVLQRTTLLTGAARQAPGPGQMESTATGSAAAPQPPSVDPGLLTNLLCGVADVAGQGIGLALIERMDFQRQEAILLSPAAGAEIRILQFGDLYLSAEGQELGRRPRGAF